MAVERIDRPDVAAWIRDRAGTSQRFLVGIVGPPGSGKSTLAAGLAAELGAAVVPMDGFHLANAMLDERGLRRVKGAPETFDADAFVAAVGRLVAADSDVLLPDFDRVGDEPRPGRIRVRSTDAIVIVEGNYLLLERSPWSAIGELLDVTVYIELDRATRVDRLVARHVEFGASFDHAAAFVRDSDEANTALIEPTRDRADVIVSDPEAVRGGNYR